MNVTTRAFKLSGVRPVREPELQVTKAMFKIAYHEWHVRRFGYAPSDYSMEAAIRNSAEEALQLRDQ